MFKRVIMLLLATLLLASAACAEPADALYLLVDGEQTLGTAVLYKDQNTLLTTLWTLLDAPLEDLRAVGAGGSLPVAAGNGTLNADLVELTLEEASPATPLAISEGAQTVYVLGHDLQQQSVHAEAAYLSVIPYGEEARVMYTAPAALLPGSVLVDEQGDLCGVTLAAYGESVNRYMALSATEITPMESSDTAWLQGFTVTPGVGEFTVDWSACDLSCEREDCVISLFFADSMNPFYSYMDHLEGTSIVVPVVPGRSYEMWMQHAHQQIDHTVPCPEEAVATVEIAPAEPFVLYDYQDAEIYLSAAPMKGVEGYYNTYLPPVETINTQTLSDPETAIFLQVSSSYTVEKNEEAILLVALTTPEGYVLDYLGGFTFDAALQERDNWNVELYPLLDDYLSMNGTGEFAAGEYTVSYYLDGALGNSFTWVME